MISYEYFYHPKAYSGYLVHNFESYWCWKLDYHFLGRQSVQHGKWLLSLFPPNSYLLFYFCSLVGLGKKRKLRQVAQSFCTLMHAHTVYCMFIHMCSWNNFWAKRTQNQICISVHVLFIISVFKLNFSVENWMLVYLCLRLHFLCQCWYWQNRERKEYMPMAVYWL